MMCARKDKPECGVEGATTQALTKSTGEEPRVIAGGTGQKQNKTKTTKNDSGG